MHKPLPEYIREDYFDILLKMRHKLTTVHVPILNIIHLYSEYHIKPLPSPLY